jgi:GTPase
MDTITQITQELNADFANIDNLNGLDPNYKATTKSGQIAHLMIRKRPQSVQELLEIRVAVVGNVDAGKVCTKI